MDAIDPTFFSCLRKQRHENLRKALAHIDRLRLEQRRGVSTLVAYKCELCAGYHVGHKRTVLPLAA